MAANRMSSKGEVFTLTVVILAVIAGIAATLLTPIGDILKRPGDGQKSTQKQVETTSTVPYIGPNGEMAYVVDSKGNRTPLMVTRTSMSSLDEVSQPKKSLWQKIVSIGWWWLALTIIGFFWGPLGTVMAWINGKAKKAALAVAEAAKVETEKLTYHSKKIVTSVDAGRAELDKAIAAAQAAYDAAQKAAAPSAEAPVVAANAAIMSTQRAILDVLTKLKRDTKDAMTMVQGAGSSTEAVVAKLK